MDENTDSRISLACRGLSHWFGSNKVLFDIDLRVKRGQFMALVGPSGCGKSTLLRAIVGTHLPRRGQVLAHADTGIGLVPIEGPGRDRGIVYQHYSLFPFLTARENVAVGLTLDQTSIPFRTFRYFKWRKLRKQHLDEADEFLASVKMTDARNLYPHEMSGGMRQRVAIAQTLIMKPEIILLDEPFGALDEATREELQVMLLELYAENRAALARNEKPPYTLIIVTHELVEAIYVGDRLVGLSQYWNWKDAGHEDPPGATIIYDKPSPVFAPNDVRNFESFVQQRNEVRSIVFNPEGSADRDEHNTYWRDTGLLSH